jgi:hypothetical protein
LKGLHRLVAIFIMVFFFLPAFCQERDTIVIMTTDTISKSDRTNQKDSLFLAKHSPKKATIYSAVLPGLGQIYNRKYWKVPIVYAGFGGLIYGIVYNTDQYKYYKEHYVYMLDNNLTEWDGMTISQAEAYKDFHKRWKNLFSLATAGFYVLQILDANVDASLINYDISEDIALVIEPAIILCDGINNSVGLRCCLNF